MLSRYQVALYWTDSVKQGKDDEYFKHFEPFTSWILQIKKICEVPNLWCIETIDKRKHCELFDRQMRELNKKLNVFVQVNTSNEQNKGGIEPRELRSLVEYILHKCSNLNFKGTFELVVTKKFLSQPSYTRPSNMPATCICTTPTRKSEQCCLLRCLSGGGNVTDKNFLYCNHFRHSLCVNYQHV